MTATPCKRCRKPRRGRRPAPDDGYCPGCRARAVADVQPAGTHRLHAPARAPWSPARVHRPPVRPRDGAPGEGEAVLYGLLTRLDAAELERRRAKRGAA